MYLYRISNLHSNSILLPSSIYSETLKRIAESDFQHIVYTSISDGCIVFDSLYPINYTVFTKLGVAVEEYTFKKEHKPEPVYRTKQLEFTVNHELGQITLLPGNIRISERAFDALFELKPDN